MAQENTTTTEKKTTKISLKTGWLNIIAFVAVICIGISLILSKVGLSGEISNALSTIAQAISYLILIVISCFYIIKRRNVWLWVTWGVSVVLIVVSFIL